MIEQPELDEQGHVSQKALPMPEPPRDDKWTRRRLLTARSAIFACTACRNQVSRGFSELANQLQGVPVIGDPALGATMFFVGDPATLPEIAPGQLRPVSVPNGLGGTSTALYGALSLAITVGSLLELDIFAREQVEKLMTRVGNAVRTKTGDCCRRQVYRRLLPQSNRRRTVKVKSKRTRHP